MKITRLTPIVACLCASVAVDGVAETRLVELGRYGPTSDASAYIARLRHARNPEQATVQLVQKARRYPITSAGIDPGAVAGFAIDLPQLHTPICVVGYDTLSEQWVRRYRDALLAANAICIVTNVATEEELAAVKQWLAPVPSFAAQVNDLFDPISLSAYPVILSRRAVEQ